MTKTALEKLTENQLAYCKTLSSIIAREREYLYKYGVSRTRENVERQAGRLRGFLECLCQMGVLTGSEAKVLCQFFFSEDRSKRSES